ncbi:MAG: phytanoyl-CoA dioxygenase family protein [Chthonomonadaceae bacterium]|nr:phytanoyl-CoA dioxygenase family protein [Chthonomonadaceae bacterium]
MPYTTTYTIHSFDNPQPTRTIEADVTSEQVNSLLTDGYLVRESLVSGELLEELRAAADEIADANGAEVGAAQNSSRQFGGLFIRNLMDKHPTFLKLLKFEPTLSLARAVLGPQVQVHASVLRVTYPGQEKQETQWHFHQRVIPEPMPPWFGRPRVLDNLIYLDDLDDATGPFCVVPGSHTRLHDPLYGDDFSDKPDQVLLRIPAGSCVTADAGLWHRGMATRPDGKIRRLIILGYSPTWMKTVDRMGGGLTDSLRENADWETRELLGIGGYY